MRFILNMDGISFRQKINIVDYNAFYKLMENGGKEIGYHMDAPLFVRGKRFSTIGVKTCSGGGLTDGRENSAGFHLLDCEEHYNQIDSICNDIFYSVKDPVSGLLVGGKNISRCPYSIPMFLKMANFFADKIKNLSVFFEHTGALGFGSTSFIHDTETDTWTLLAMRSGYPVENMDDMKKCYRYVHIADDDILQFSGKDVPKEEIKAAFPKNRFIFNING